MNRMEFMRELEARLSDIPENERREAMQYYEDYLNDAGVENEQGAMEELGTPEEIARHIKSGLNGADAGEFTENGYESGSTKKNPLAMQYENTEQSRTEKKEKTQGNGVRVLLTVLLLVLLSPVILPFAAALLGLLAGAVCAVGGTWIGLLAAGVAFFFAGIICLIVGIVKLFTIPLAGAVVTGVGLLMIGIGLFLSVLLLWLAWKLVPPLLRGFVNLCRRPFTRKEKRNV
ncbi:MAG: DUF1700 domain-containing protein [Clostridiales bacterium]|nr:DUF1700 domain-containing protein [Clostridiales bacterium]